MNLADRELNKNVPVPLYYQLKQLLLEEIQSGRLKEHDCLPTEIELAAMFGISRPTVRQAINELVNEGYLSRLKGKGTYVTKPKISQEFVHVIENFNDGMLRKGVQPKTKVLGLQMVEADEELMQALNVEPGDKVIELSRLRYANDEPIVLVTTYIPYALCPQLLDADFRQDSLYKIFEAHSLTICKVRRVFEAQMATAQDAVLLDINAGEPLLCFDTTAYLDAKTIIEYSHCRYRGDRNKFMLEVLR